MTSILGVKFCLSICNKVYFIDKYKCLCISLLVVGHGANSVTGSFTLLRGF